MRCARCGTEVLPGKRFCHACGEPVGRACPRCRASLVADYSFCPDCGFALASAAPGGAETGREPGTTPAVEPQGSAADGRLEARSREGTGSDGGRGVAEPLDIRARQIPEALASRIRASAGTSAGERKRATVMFCDLVGSTAIAAGLDPEEYRELLDQYLEICFREIYRYEGIVNQLAGDGMMALFGAPIAHEDAPERAVRAALAIRDALAAFSARELAERDFELRTRFGINTGPVVVGSVGNDLKMDYTAIGDTTNLAARLESLASPETILLSEATARLVRDRFELRARPPVAVKGKAEPVVAYEVVRALELDGALAVPRSRGLTPLVARDQELDQMLACFDRLAGRLPQVVAIVGEAGSGKSRLLFEFEERLAGREMTLLEARCSALSQMLPYSPWIAMVRQAFRVDPHDPTETAIAKLRAALECIDSDPDELAEKLSVFFRTSGGLADEPADELKRETFEAMSRLVDDLCRVKPLVIVFEDLHWIDDLSREMLEIAASQLVAYPIMIVVTHRPEFEPRWRTRAAYTELHLRPLASAEAVEMARAVAGGELPAALEERIAGKAEGNPFLLEEIVRGLVEEGFLRKLDQRIELTRPVAEIPIPETVQELVGARLDRLGPHGKRVAQVAAVLGRQFRRDSLLTLLGADGIDVGAELDELERRGLLHRKTALSEDEYRFGESVVQELAYSSLLVRERRQLHERIARLLESAPDELTPERSALLAHHYALSEDRSRAAAALLRAARDAERLPSYVSALKLYRQAWDIVSADVSATSTADARRRALEAALGLCRIVMLYGAVEETEDLIAVAHRGRELAEGLEDVGARAMLSLYEGLFEMSGGGDRFARGLALAERGTEIARAAGLKLVELSIRRGLAWSYLFDARFAAALDNVTAVVAELVRMDPPERPSDLQFGARYMAASMLLHAGRLEEAFEQMTEIHDLARQHNNRTIRSGSAAGLAQLLFARGDYAAAVRWADEGLALGEQIGNAGAIRPCAAIALGSRLALGQPVNAPRYLGSLELGLASAGLLPLYVRIVVEVLIAAGDLRTAERCLEVSSRHSGGRLREMMNLSARGELLLQQGARQIREAQRATDRAIELARETRALTILAATLVTAGDIALAAGDARTARERAREAIEIGGGLRLGRYVERAERLLADASRSVAGATG